MTQQFVFVFGILRGINGAVKKNDNTFFHDYSSLKYSFGYMNFGLRLFFLVAQDIIKTISAKFQLVTMLFKVPSNMRWIIYTENDENMADTV